MVPSSKDVVEEGRLSPYATTVLVFWRYDTVSLALLGSVSRPTHLGTVLHLFHIPYLGPWRLQPHHHSRSPFRLLFLFASVL
jgi:hypothetical protein